MDRTGVPLNPTGERGHLKALTGLRFLAALPVVLFHVLPRPAMPAWAGRLADLGYVSVGLFFVLSGFVLAYAYANPDGEIDKATFYRNRFARIYPVYALAMLIALPAFARAYEYLQLPRAEFGIDVLLRFLLVHAWHPGTMKYYNVPSWSLSVEAFFYLIFPLLLPSVMRIRPSEVVRSLVAVLALAAFAPAVFEWAYPGTSPAVENYRVLMIKFHPLVRLPEFLAGMLLGRLFVGTEVRISGDRADRLLALAVAAIVAAIALRMPYVLLHTGGLAVAFTVIVWALASGQGRAAAALATPPLVRLGEASYALYILHLPVFGILEYMAAARGIRIGTVGFALAAVVALIGISLLVNRLFEVPMRRLLRAPVYQKYPD
ncbi:MAG: acyltransferase family protein [Fimbriimonas sp.]